VFNFIKIAKIKILVGSSYQCIDDDFRLSLVAGLSDTAVVPAALTTTSS